MVRIVAGQGDTVTPAVKVDESRFRDFWQHQIRTGEVFVTEGGEPLRVVYPGRPNDRRGADFRDAVVIAGGELRTGDVEIHLDSTDWKGHGHHRDGCYDRVILHVVMHHNDGNETVLRNGRAVPVLNLGKHIDLSRYLREEHIPEETSFVPCRLAGRKQTAHRVRAVLEDEGEVRFFEKSGRFLSLIEHNGGPETLYRAFMRALGYAGNTDPFLELACRVPLSVVEKDRQGARTDEEYIKKCQALLLGSAGFFLPDLRCKLRTAVPDPERAAGLENTWLQDGRREVMPGSAWRFFRIRPVHSPVRRLLAMGVLLGNYRSSGLCDGLMKTMELSGDSRDVEQALTVTGDGYGMPGALLGRGCAAAVTLNVLLPFSFALHCLPGTPGTDRGREKILALYRRYPRVADNSLEKHMEAQLGIRRSDITSARQQQGLIHIYNTYCARGRCGDCGLGESEAG